jgi:hypothetical protein
MIAQDRFIRHILGRASTALLNRVDQSSNLSLAFAKVVFPGLKRELNRSSNLTGGGGALDQYFETVQY